MVPPHGAARSSPESSSQAGSYILGSKFSRYKVANCCRRNEVFSNVFVTFRDVRRNLLTHDAEKAFAIRIEDTGSGVSGRRNITDQRRKLISQRKWQRLRRNDVGSRGVTSIHNDDWIPWPRRRFA